jgi:hypothetical protein
MPCLDPAGAVVRLGHQRRDAGSPVAEIYEVEADARGLSLSMERVFNFFYQSFTRSRLNFFLFGEWARTRRRPGCRINDDLEITEVVTDWKPEEFRLLRKNAPGGRSRRAPGNNSLDLLVIWPMSPNLTSSR